MYGLVLRYFVFALRYRAPTALCRKLRHQLLFALCGGNKRLAIIRDLALPAIAVHFFAQRAVLPLQLLFLLNLLDFRQVLGRRG